MIELVKNFIAYCWKIPSHASGMIYRHFQIRKRFCGFCYKHFTTKLTYCFALSIVLDIYLISAVIKFISCFVLFIFFPRASRNDDYRFFMRNFKNASVFLIFLLVH